MAANAVQARQYSQFGINERLVYVRPDGVQFRLHAPPSRTVLSQEGFGMPPLQYVADRSPLQSGDNVRYMLLQPRPIQIVVYFNFNSRQEYWDGRAELLDTIRPNRITNFNTPGSLLFYHHDRRKRQIDVTLDSGPGFAPPEPGWREWSFTEVLRFIAHDPVWYDPLSQSGVFTVSSTATFPMTFPVTFSTLGSQVSVTYTGTWAEYPSFVVTGPVTGLRIDNLTTGKAIVVSGDIPSGMSATITLRGTKSIIRNDGQNMLNQLSPDSDLTSFALEPDPIAPGGVNVIQLTGTGTSGATAASMQWYTRYIGI